MGRTSTIALREFVDNELLLEIARAMRDSALHRDPGFLEGSDNELSEEDELFGDHDQRTLERGFYAHSREECRSRRIDLRTAADRDPGPLEMGEAEAVVEAEPVVHLRFDSD